MYTKISVVIPALNEEKTIESVIRKIPRDLAKATEIIVVDNASEDRTADIAKKAGATVVYEPKRGYGNAYLAGFAHATGEIIIMADADDTYPIHETGLLLAEMEKSGLDLVLGSRFRGGIKDMPLVNKLGNIMITITTKLLFGMCLSDTTSGFRAIKKGSLRRLALKSPGMDMSPEMLVMASRRGLKIGEVPIEYREREKWLKKLRPFRDGLRMFAAIFRVFLSRD